MSLETPFERHDSSGQSLVVDATQKDCCHVELQSISGTQVFETQSMTSESTVW